jgi:carbon storage regulator
VRRSFIRTTGKIDLARQKNENSFIFFSQILDKTPFRSKTAKRSNVSRSNESLRPLAERIAMLVLTRRINESIVINDNVSVLVVEVRGDRVRLGIEAPKDVAVHRKEVYDVIQESGLDKPKKQASSRHLVEK